jgi:hypothetical protein
LPKSEAEKYAKRPALLEHSEYLAVHEANFFIDRQGDGREGDIDRFRRHLWLEEEPDSAKQTPSRLSGSPHSRGTITVAAPLDYVMCHAVEGKDESGK